MITKVADRDTRPGKKEDSSSKKFRTLTNAIRFCTWTVGADVTKPEYKFYWRTYMTGMLIFMFMLCTGYTVYVDVVINADWVALLQTCCQSGAGIQGGTKFLCVLFYRK
ncbi:hypothetical protein M5D96_006617 [Drosophila gunungcola]|uniref:Uncharacterized protein n=2 Tax=Drosophila gunungcola TaxID=103775 RepID=A0A9P9YPB7_9MUSC|nr:hypothetical protein M5D96_006617 [Drosophila gunungcola]